MIFTRQAGEIRRGLICFVLAMLALTEKCPKKVPDDNLAKNGP